MNTVKINVNFLAGPALNWAVAMAEGLEVRVDSNSIKLVGQPFDREYEFWAPIGDWEQAGPIIEREGLTLTHQTDKWAAQTDCDLFSYGPTPLIAAMRCYVASKLGEIVEVPRELYKEEDYV